MLQCVLLPLLLVWASFSMAAELSVAQLTNKIKLVDHVLLDIKTKSGDLFATNQLFSDGYHYALNELQQAKQALQQQELVEAGKHVEQAFINMSYARSFLKKATTSPIARQQSYAKLSEEVVDYISALAEALGKKPDAIGQQQLAKAKELKALADEMLYKQELSEADKQLAVVYDILVTTLSRVKDKETSIVTLNFETPKDEYLYEIKRFESYQMLLKQQMNSTLSDDKKRLITRFSTQASEDSKGAAKAATGNDYPQAISMLEAANENLKRALRMTGLSMF